MTYRQQLNHVSSPITQMHISAIYLMVLLSVWHTKKDKVLCGTFPNRHQCLDSLQCFDTIGWFLEGFIYHNNCINYPKRCFWRWSSIGNNGRLTTKWSNSVDMITSTRTSFFVWLTDLVLLRQRQLRWFRHEVHMDNIRILMSLTTLWEAQRAWCNEGGWCKNS